MALSYVCAQYVLGFGDKTLSISKDAKAFISFSITLYSRLAKHALKSGLTCP